MDSLKLENQICFPLYACSKEVTRKYKPFLDQIDLTYTQYITMMVLWDKQVTNVKELGEILYLDSGTLTPLLKKLEIKGLIVRKRNKKDERNLEVTITNDGKNLKKKASNIPIKMGKCLDLSEKDAFELYNILYKILNSLENNKK